MRGKVLGVSLAARQHAPGSSCADGKIASMPSPMNLRISPPSLSTAAAIRSNHWFNISMMASSGSASVMRVKPRRSQYQIAAGMVSPSPRRMWPLRMCSPASRPT